MVLGNISASIQLKTLTHYYSRNSLQPLFVLSKETAVDVGSDSDCILLSALVVATQVFGQLLAIVELDISHSIFTNDCVGPKLLHEEYLVREVRTLCMSGEKGR